MNNIKSVIFAVMVGISMNSFAADPIPDPTVQIMTPPAGLPGTKLEQPVIQNYNELNIQGIFIDDNKLNQNKVFMNNGFYKIGDIVNDLWKVQSITRKKVVLINVETKQIKNLNISGE